MLKKVPHRHEVIRIIRQVLLVKETVVKVDVLKPLKIRTVFKVDAGGLYTVFFTHIREKGSNRTPHVEYFRRLIKLYVLADDSVLIAVVLPHRPFIKRCQNAPIGFLPVGDILVVVEARNGLNIDPGF